MRFVQVLLTVTAPMLTLGIWQGQPGQANNRPLIAELPPLPSLTEEEIASDKMIWVQLQERIGLGSLAELLGLQGEELSRLNEKSEAHLYLSGSWVKLPAEAVDELEFISAVDAESRRTSPPVLAPPPVGNTARVQSGDSLNTFLSRNGLTWDELRSLNPGLELSSMAAGSELTVAKASSARQLLAIRPTISGGASWPRRPQFETPVKQAPEFLNNSYSWPTKGIFTSGYGWRWGRMHKGIDIANNTGTPIHAARDGIITYSGWSSGYGYLVEMSHADGESTRYAHNSRLLVKKGQVVPQGARISLMGSTGRSTGPHLHFEIRRSGGAAVNPLSKLPTRQA